MSCDEGACAVVVAADVAADVVADVVAVAAAAATVVVVVVVVVRAGRFDILVIWVRAFPFPVSSSSPQSSCSFHLLSLGGRRRIGRSLGPLPPHHVSS